MEKDKEELVCDSSPEELVLELWLWKQSALIHHRKPSSSPRSNNLTPSDTKREIRASVSR